MELTGNETSGRIIAAKSGFYYVDCGSGLLTCRGGGRLRNASLTPLVGDIVTVRVDETEGGLNYVTAVSERKNHLTRPPIANIDHLFIISSVVRPTANTLINDKLCAAAVQREIEPVILVTKTDLADPAGLLAHYERSGIRALVVSAITGEGLDELRRLLPGKLSAFTGNSGAGKSTLLNALDPSLGIQTNEISDKLGRGRHTTRTVELYRLCGGYAADTPGFSSPELADVDSIDPSELAYDFPEFREYIPRCRFTSDCRHIKDLGCAVRAAAEDGLISPGRYANYVRMATKK